MLKTFGIIMFYTMIWWFDDQDIGVKAKNQGLILLLRYIMWSMDIHRYILYMCIMYNI